MAPEQQPSDIQRKPCLSYSFSGAASCPQQRQGTAAVCVASRRLGENWILISVGVCPLDADDCDSQWLNIFVGDVWFVSTDVVFSFGKNLMGN